MKLELKHLAPYLPYELKIRCGEISHPILTCADTNEFEIAIKEVFINSAYKPILRPLSDLTKEIEVNGEKFVPLYNICSMQGFTMPNIKNCEFEFHCQFNKTATITMDGWIFRYLDKEKSFWLNGIAEWSKKHQKSNRQLEMFEKLFEWHFDVFGLIEKGLAVDINTLNK